MKFNTLVFFGILFSTSMLARAEAGEPAKAALDSCYQAALKQSESLASQYQLVVQAEEHYNQALGSLVPALTAGGIAFWQNQAMGASSPVQQNTVKISASMPLFQGLREYAALRQAGDLVRSQKLASRWASLQLFADTARAFNLVLSAEKTLADYRDQYDLYDKRVAFLKGWLSIGRAQDTDVLSVETARAQVKAAMEQAKYQVEQARDLLAFLTGLSKDTQLDDTQRLPENLASFDEYLKTLEARPDIQAAQENVKAAKEGANIAWGQHLPAVAAGADYYAYRYDPLADNNWDATISISMPIFTGGVISAQTRAAEAQAKQAELALQQVRRLDEENLRDIYARVTYDAAQEKALQDALALAEKNYKAQSRNSELGLVTNLDVLQSLVTFVTTQQALDAVHYSVFADLSSLEAQAGQVSNIPDNDKK